MPMQTSGDLSLEWYCKKTEDRYIKNGKQILNISSKEIFLWKYIMDHLQMTDKQF